MKYIGAFFAHGTVIFSLILIVLLIVDRLNPTMDFLGNDMAKLFVFLLCVCGILSSLFSLLRNKKK